MIDIDKRRYYGISDAAKLIPGRGDKPISRITLNRWVSLGLIKYCINPVNKRKEFFGKDLYDFINSKIKLQ